MIETILKQVWYVLDVLVFITCNYISYNEGHKNLTHD